MPAPEISASFTRLGGDHETGNAIDLASGSIWLPDSDAGWRHTASHLLPLGASGNDVRIVHVGDVAAVAPAIAAALQGQADVVLVPLAQRGASWHRMLKPLVAPARIADALVTARRVVALKPDVVHIHWVPNGVVGLFLDKPWVLHAHGSDVRNSGALRRWFSTFIMRRASVVVYSTPDLRPFVEQMRPGAAYLPTPIPYQPERQAADEWDVLLASRAAAAKGARTAFRGLRGAQGRIPSLRAAAVDGPLFEAIAARLPFSSKEVFLRHVSRSRVVVGQFAASALGISELEAMSFGRPVISAADVGLYAEPPPIREARSEEEVTSAIIELVNNAERADRLGEAGRTWVRRHFSPADVAAQLMALYHSLHSATGRRG